MAQKTNTDKGRPTGNKPIGGTGVPANISAERLQQDERLTDQYTNEDRGLSEGIHAMHPNRNLNKGRGETGLHGRWGKGKPRKG